MYVCMQKNGDTCTRAYTRAQARGITPELRRVVDTTPHGFFVSRHFTQTTVGSPSPSLCGRPGRGSVRAAVVACRCAALRSVCMNMNDSDLLTGDRRLTVVVDGWVFPCAISPLVVFPPAGFGGCVPCGLSTVISLLSCDHTCHMALLGPRHARLGRAAHGGVHRHHPVRPRARPTLLLLANNSRVCRRRVCLVSGGAAALVRWWPRQWPVVVTSWWVRWVVPKSKA